MGARAGRVVAMVAALAAVLLLPACTSSSAPRKPLGTDTIELHPRDARNPLGYVAFLPPGYRTDTDPVPTIVYLHGLGERGNGSDLDLRVLMTAGLPRLAATNTLPQQARRFLILAPQSNGGFVRPAQIHAWLHAVLPRFRIDHDRMYLTGISMGGQGVFDYLNRYGDANEFAAMAPIAGTFTAQPVPDGVPSCARMADTPLWAFHGADDDTVPTQGSIQVVANVDRHCHPPEPLRLTIYSDSFHNVWDRTYDLTGMNTPSDDRFQRYDTDIYDWLLRHERHDRPLTGGR